MEKPENLKLLQENLGKETTVRSLALTEPDLFCIHSFLIVFCLTALI